MANLVSVKDAPKMRPIFPTESAWRNLIFRADPIVDRRTGMVLNPGNGLAPAIVRLGRKVLIDLDAFDTWVEQHRGQDHE